VIGAIGFAGCTTKIESIAVAPGSAAAPTAVATAFMQAVADSNLTQMGELWGTAKGSAATTGEPANWLQRLSVIHAYLKGGTARVLGENPGAMKDDRRQLMVEVTRPGCVKSVPFTMVRTKQGAWLVNAIELNAAGVPGRPCEGGQQPSW
jgi:hypothetical protein